MAAVHGRTRYTLPMRPRRWVVLALLGLLAATPVACATADLGEDDGVAVPERNEAGTEASKFEASGPAPDVVEPPPVDAGDGGDSAVKSTPRVFVTSTSRNANVAGLAGGDLTCTNLAISAGLIGKWAAWLSVQNGPHASDRVTSVGPWSLVTGEVVATTRTQLVSGTLAHAIDHDEKGVLVAPSRVWTGTGTDGRYLTNDCDKWTNGANGRAGNSASTTATWTTAGVDDCGQLGRLYCFEL